MGALAGGLVADGAGVTAVMWLGGGLAVAALAVTALGKTPSSGRF